MNNHAVRVHTNDQKNDDDNQLNTCCGRTSDKRLLTFIASLSISILIIMLCSYQLITKLDCVSQNVYVGILTLIIGVWCPHPVRS